jgi:predicted aspartyl protease
MKPHSLLLAVSLALFPGADPAQAQTRNASGSLEYREFIGTNGNKIEAAIVDKNDAGVVLLLIDGKRLQVAFDKLSEDDQEYARKWTKEKAIFLSRCRSLTVRQLLELRGYESFKFRLVSNSMIVEGELNGTPAKFLIDTGAGSSVLHLPSAEEAGCEIGPMDQKIYGIAGEAPAAWTEVPEMRLGNSVIKNRRLLSADLMEDRPAGSPKQSDAIFGADFMSQLRAVISYREGRIFLRPDLVDRDPEAEPEAPDFRIFKTDDGKTYNGKVARKTASAVDLKLDSGKDIQLGLSRLSKEDQEFVSNWSPEAAEFMKNCRGLTVLDLLELREYQSIEYDRRGNHIFVDGKLNELEIPFMIDTGADTSVLHVGAAESAGCEIGEMNQKIYGIGGEAPAAVCKVKLIEMGEALIENRSILATDLFRLAQREEYGAIFGADFLRELNGVITYKENRIFLRQD